MQRCKEEARGGRGWTRFLAGSTLALGLAWPGVAGAEPAPDNDGAAEVRVGTPSEAGETQPSSATSRPSETSTSGNERSEALMNERGNCENNYAQTCFQAGAPRAPTERRASYAQFHFQPGAGYAR